MQTSTIFALFGVLALANAGAISNQFSWEKFKETHGKTYLGAEDETFRRGLFETTVENVKKHNLRYLSGLETYEQEVNRFADRKLSEITSGCFIQNSTFTQENVIDFPKNVAGYVDWRTHSGVVTPVKNQGQCGSCWSFSSTGAMEGQMMIKKQQAVSLSEQQLVDCTRYTGNAGCGGGWMTKAFGYSAQYGLESEQSYPYYAQDMQCRYDSSRVVAKNTGFQEIRQGDDDALAAAVANVGPVAVAINVNQNWSNYRSGIFYDPYCPQYPLTHAVLAVGYGYEASRQMTYYIVKNSWGTSWGDRGYIKMAARYNMCGIANMASYPTF